MNEGTLTITNADYLNFYLNYIAKNSGIVAENYIIEYSQDQSLVLISAPVAQNLYNLSSVGTTLRIISNEAFLINDLSPLALSNGGGVTAEITCKGDPCSSCYMEVLSWVPFVPNCGCNKSGGSGGKCNMEITYKVEISGGFPVKGGKGGGK